jgi:hypothetical protein
MFSNMENMTDDEDLIFNIAFALSQYGYKPPRTHNTEERDRYFRQVAKAVKEHLERTWEMKKRTFKHQGATTTGLMGGRPGGKSG